MGVRLVPQDIVRVDFAHAAILGERPFHQRLHRLRLERDVDIVLVAKAPRDGYTLLYTNCSHSSNPAHYRKLPYDSTADFAPVTQSNVTYGNVLVVHPAVPGGSVKAAGDRLRTLRAEIHSLYPLRSARLYRRGEPVEAFDVAGRRGEVVVETTRREPPGEPAWYVLRVDDERGHWAITSPIFVNRPTFGPRPAASALILEIHNATRYIELRREFFRRTAGAYRRYLPPGGYRPPRGVGWIKHRLVRHNAYRAWAALRFAWRTARPGPPPDAVVSGPPADRVPA